MTAQRIYFIALNDDDTPALFDYPLLCDSWLEDGFQLGELFIPEWAIFPSESEALDQLLKIEAELGIASKRHPTASLQGRG